MKTFTLNDTYSVVCERKKTRSAFKHEATLLKNWEQIDSTKICYQNRTREAYEFESVLYKLLAWCKLFSQEEVKQFMDVAWWKSKQEVEDNFKMIWAIAKMWEVFWNTPQEKNDWKTRMLKAGLPWLEIPSDWDTLTEDEKQIRLDMVIAELA